MPNYFQLINKVTGEAESFNSIDIKLCALLNEAVDPKWYIWGWYDAVGELAAAGRTFEQIKDIYADTIKENAGFASIVNYLEEHYTINSGYSPKGY